MVVRDVMMSKNDAAYPSIAQQKKQAAIDSARFHSNN
jgi:hypothetical protein